MQVNRISKNKDLFAVWGKTKSSDPCLYY